MKTVLLAMSGLLISAPAAFAGAVAVPVPEPSTLAIVAVGVAGAIVASRFRNKK